MPLQPPDVSTVPQSNAVQTCRLADYDDPSNWPNIAVLSFTREWDEVIRDARLVADSRTILDLPDLVLAWLGYAWAVTGASNPLLVGTRSAERGVRRDRARPGRGGAHAWARVRGELP